MKIYFTGSINNEKQKVRMQKIVKLLEKVGNEVYSLALSEKFANQSLVSARELKGHFKEWSSYVRDSDCAVVEASYPSDVQVGFEIGTLLSRAKVVVLLFEKGNDPVFIDNVHSKRLIKCEYQRDDLEEVLEWALEEAEKISDRRFTFNISPEIDDYLEKASRKKGVSRSEYIRELIVRDGEYGG